VSFIIFIRKKFRKLLSDDGFLLPYSLMLLVLVMTTGIASTSLFLSKHHYLNNMGKVYERKVSVAHGVLLAIERSSPGTFKQEGAFGQTETKTTMLSEEDMVMEITYQSHEKVFQPVSVVYNKETKHIIDWK
jgi:hypothetical protein